MYQTTIGLEIHTELKTKRKMFCSCLNDSDEHRPNFNICPICVGHPGTLPVTNKEAVRMVIKTGLALSCRIPEFSKFDRKNYFYPDLPKGYQISQYDQPLCKEGFLKIGEKNIRIRRVHLEEDTGRLIHESDGSLVDFNRAGIPLMELVTEPDIASGKEARKFAEELQLILRYLGISDADMEKGQMRVEVNISLSKSKDVLGTKVEIKNLNSFKAVEKAIEYEIKRQEEALAIGEKIIQETRGWDDAMGTTVSQRQKEESHDYRYFPEPDLLPLHFSEEDVESIKRTIFELPQNRRERLKREYELDENAIEVFIQNKTLGEYFEKTVSEFNPRITHEELTGLLKLAANYLTSDLLGLLKETELNLEGILITPENFAEFIGLIRDGKISSKIAKIVLKEMFVSGSDPSHIIEEKGLEQMSDRGELEKIIDEAIENNQKVVEDYKNGKGNALQFLVGQIMAQTRGKANPQMVGEILKKKVKNT